MPCYVRAVLREAEQRKALMDEPVQTAYIGGGTPSLLPASRMEELIRGIRGILDLSDVKEFTVEANPGTVTPEWLDACALGGVNRISFGVQAYQDELLRTLGRIHRFPDAVRSVESARRAGIDNISLDLMFGLPGQTRAQWTETLEAALSLKPTHISAYGLIPEEGTPIFEQLQKGLLTLPEPEEEREMYDDAIRILDRAGMKQYEISNFALPGFESRHNIGYWDQVPYLGLGVAAASMYRPRRDGIFCIRENNPESMEEYIRMTETGDGAARAAETVAGKDARFETLMLALRMNKGLSRRRFRELHGTDLEDCYGDTAERLRAQGLLMTDEEGWRLTRRGMDIQNSVLLEFMEEKD